MTPFSSPSSCPSMMFHSPHSAVRAEPWGTHTRRQRPAPPSPLDRPVRKPSQAASESPTCLKCIQMQFDLSSKLREAHPGDSHSPDHQTHPTTQPIPLTPRFSFCPLNAPRRKQNDIYLVMFLYGFVPLWFQVVVCFVALIFPILPAALPYVV